MEIVVDLAQHGVRAHRFVPHAVVSTSSGADGRAYDVNAKLEQQPPLGTATDAHDVARRVPNADDRLDHVAQCERVALKRTNHNMIGRMIDEARAGA